MAGGKETPRQKMIGMMYLVLTALLALNVSKSILDAFVAIEENIQISNLNVPLACTLRARFAMFVQCQFWRKIYFDSRYQAESSPIQALFSFCLVVLNTIGSVGPWHFPVICIGLRALF